MAKTKNTPVIKFQQVAEHSKGDTSTQDRVKSVSFHPKRPLVLASYHDSRIQLWDYSSEVLLGTFTGHLGSVRGIHFHPTQPLFVSGGDDGLVKVWNYQQKKCLFTLSGHVDYIRSVQFHNHYPWIVSASDDRTVRIWNWQSRSHVATLTGHNYYVMCARFHPTKDLIISASLDTTIRIWDFSALVQRTVSLSSSHGNQQANQNDLFRLNVEVAHVLEGHSKGVNWADFHPTLPLVVSGSDDLEVKVWRVNESRAWLLDTLRGHSKSVSCVAFHPRLDLIVSNSEDNTLRIWDVNKKSAPIIINREGEKFWTLDIHPTQALIAAGHDYGFMLLKLHRERPAMCTIPQYPNIIFMVKDNAINAVDMISRTSIPLISLNRQTTNYTALPHTLSYNMYNSTHIQFCLTWTDDRFDVYSCPKPQNFPCALSDVQHVTDTSKQVLFVSNNRFAVYGKDRNITLRDMSNNVKRKLTINGASNIYSGGNNRLLVRFPDGILLYDIQACRSLNELKISARNTIKYVTHSPNGKHMIIQSKSSIYITTNQLVPVLLISEPQKIKGCLWFNNHVIYYLTTTHIKFALLSGEYGALSTLENIVYPVSVTALPSEQVCPGVQYTQLTAICKDGTIVTKRINPIEYMFRLALYKRKVQQITQILSSGLMSSEVFLQLTVHRGYPELALKYCKDIKRKFELAILSGNLEVAKTCASELNQAKYWDILAAEALQQGNIQIAESCFVMTKQMNQVNMLYVLTNNEHKLSKLYEISQKKNDVTTVMNYMVNNRDIPGIVQGLQQNKYSTYAQIVSRVNELPDSTGEDTNTDTSTSSTTSPYMVPQVFDLTQYNPAHQYTVDELCRLPLGTMNPGDLQKLTPVIPPQYQDSEHDYTKVNWNILPIQRAVDTVGAGAGADDDDVMSFDPLGMDAVGGSSYGGHTKDTEESKHNHLTSDGLDDWDLKHDLSPEGMAAGGASGDAHHGAHAGDGAGSGNAEPDEFESWNIDEEFLDMPEEQAVATSTITGLPDAFPDITNTWIEQASTNLQRLLVRTSMGQLDLALYILKTNYRVMNFQMFKDIMVKLALYSTTQVPSICGMKPFTVPISDTEFKTMATCYPITGIQTVYTEAMEHFSKGRNAQAKTCLFTVLLSVLFSNGTIAQVDQYIVNCQQYLQAIRYDELRVTCGPDGTKQQEKAQYSYYATLFDLMPEHNILQLWLACKYNYQAKNLSIVGGFCRRIIDLYSKCKNTSILQGKVDIETVKKMLRKCDSEPGDQLPIQLVTDGICSVSSAPLQRMKGTAVCGLCKAICNIEYTGHTCQVCTISTMGQPLEH